MNEEFKIKLLSLYPSFTNVTGPYLRKDGRKHVCFNNSFLSQDDLNKKKTLSWPKALVEVHEGRLLIGDETVDHIDEDFSNDDLSNLQILTRMDNTVKSFKLAPDRQAEHSLHVCPQCDKEFLVLARQVRGNQDKKGKPGPFCSRSCAGKYNQSKQTNFRKPKQLIIDKDGLVAIKPA